MIYLIEFFFGFDFCVFAKVFFLTYNMICSQLLELHTQSFAMDFPSESIECFFITHVECMI